MSEARSGASERRGPNGSRSWMRADPRPRVSNTEARMERKQKERGEGRSRSGMSAGNEIQNKKGNKERNSIPWSEPETEEVGGDCDWSSG